MQECAFTQTTQKRKTQIVSDYHLEGISHYNDNSVICINSLACPVHAFINLVNIQINQVGMAAVGIQTIQFNNGLVELFLVKVRDCVLKRCDELLQCIVIVI